MSIQKKQVLKSALDLSITRPSADLLIEQYLMTPESMANQVSMLENMFRNKKIFHLGDDDHLSILFAQYLHTIPVVAEYDTRIIDSLKRQCISNKIASTVFKYDVRDKLPPNISADAFYINPPYSSKNQGKGARAWLRRAVNTVPIGSTSVMVYPIDETLPWTLECIHEILSYAYDCGLVLTNIDRDVHTYGYLPKDPGLLSSNLYLYKYANKKIKAVKDLKDGALYR